MFQAPLGHVFVCGVTCILTVRLSVAHARLGRGTWGSLCGPNNAGMFFPCPLTSTMCHSLPPKHLIYSTSLAWPVIPLSSPPDPSVFHFPLVSVQRARPRPCLEPLDRDWPSSLFLHHILRWKKKKKMTIRSDNRACFVPCNGDLEAFSIICTPYSLKRINVINIGPVVGIFSSK